VLGWGFAGRVLLEHFRGAPFLSWMLRHFDSKFGNGVFMDATDLNEFYCVKVDDFVALNAVSALQTHLHEDRGKKVGRVDVGNGATVGGGSAVSHDSRIGDFAQLGPLGIVIKGKSILSHIKWIAPRRNRRRGKSPRRPVHPPWHRRTTASFL
jgi:hypothetical protein